MDPQWKQKSKISEKLGRCGRQNMLQPYLKIWEWEWIFGRSVKAISFLGVRGLHHRASYRRSEITLGWLGLAGFWRQMVPGFGCFLSYIAVLQSLISPFFLGSSKWPETFHTVAIWTFTFHKISGFVKVILKGNFKQLHRPKVSIFDLKIQICYYHFPSIFCRICQIHCFLHTVATITKSWHVWIVFWCKNHNLDMK